MSTDGQARSFVKRTDAALADLANAEQIWSESERSNTEEMRLHSLSIDLDKAIRKVVGPFRTWANLEPAQVASVREHGPVNLLWVISAHSSGHVREAFVHESVHLSDDRILPHLANRAIDFVPAIRDLAAPMLADRLGHALAEYAKPESRALLPTPVHIVMTKLLAPRTAMVRPELIPLCIELATAASVPLTRRLRGDGVHKMLERCHQTLEVAAEPSSQEALSTLIGYFNQRAAEAKQT